MKKLVILMCLIQQTLTTEIKKPFSNLHARQAQGLALLNPIELLTSSSDDIILHRPISKNYSFAFSILKDTLDEAKKTGPSFYNLIRHTFFQAQFSTLIKIIRELNDSRKLFPERKGIIAHLTPDAKIIIKHAPGHLYEKKSTSATIVDRLVNSLRARQCIEKNSLDTLSVPNKFLLYNKKTQQWHLFVEKALLPAKGTLLTLQQLKDLAFFIERTGFTDFCGIFNNIMLNPQDPTKLMFIDLETASFTDNTETCELDFPVYLYDTEIEDSWKSKLTEEAYLYLISDKETVQTINYLPTDSTLDPVGLNLEAAKAEFNIHYNIKKN